MRKCPHDMNNQSIQEWNRANSINTVAVSQLGGWTLLSPHFWAEQGPTRAVPFQRSHKMWLKKWSLSVFWWTRMGYHLQPSLYHKQLCTSQFLTVSKWVIRQSSPTCKACKIHIYQILIISHQLNQWKKPVQASLHL